MKKNTVLFVDDEINILNALKRGVINEEYKSVFANSGEEALEIMESEDISVIVTDMRMPGMSGLQLLKIVREKHPDVVRIVLTGYTQLPQILATINQVDVFKFLTKPWSMEDEFIPLIRESVEYYNLKQESIILKQNLEKRNALYQNVLKSTEEKLANVKKDFNNMINLNNNISQYIKDEIVELEKLNLINEEVVNSQIEVYRHLYEGYLSTVPTNFTTFKIETLVQSLKPSLANNGLINRVKLELESNTSSKYYGNYTLLSFIVTKLVENILKKCTTSTLNIKFDIKGENGSSEDMSMLINLDSKSLLSLELIKSRALKLVISILNEFSKQLGGAVIIVEAGNNIFIKLHAELKKV